MDIDNPELLQWLEESLKKILSKGPKCMGIVAMMPDDDGEIVTAYFNSNAQDKAVMSHHVYSDAMLDVVLINADLIKRAIEELDESEDISDDD